jgi:hypothetical protein
MIAEWLVIYFVWRKCKILFSLYVFILRSVLEYLTNHFLELKRKGVEEEEEPRNCEKGWGCKRHKGCLHIVATITLILQACAILTDRDHKILSSRQIRHKIKFNSLEVFGYF